MAYVHFVQPMIPVQVIDLWCINIYIKTYLIGNCSE